MPTSASSRGGADFLASFAPIRPSTFTALLVITSIWIYLYARKAINTAHVLLCWSMCGLLLLINNYNTMSSSGSGVGANSHQLSSSINSYMDGSMARTNPDYQQILDTNWRATQNTLASCQRLVEQIEAILIEVVDAGSGETSYCMWCKY